MDMNGGSSLIFHTNCPKVTLGWSKLPSGLPQGWLGSVLIRGWPFCLVNNEHWEFQDPTDGGTLVLNKFGHMNCGDIPSKIGLFSMVGTSNFSRFLSHGHWGWNSKRYAASSKDSQLTHDSFTDFRENAELTCFEKVNTMKCAELLMYI